MVPSNEELVHRLKRHLSLDGLGLEVRDGRLVIDGLRVPQPRKVGEFHTERMLVEQTKGSFWLSKINWKDLHFVGADFTDAAISGGLFKAAKISNCIFENCTFCSVGIWKSELSHCQFLKCDLRDVALGGVNPLNRKKGNQYDRITFRDCDLRGTAHSFEIYRNCIFRNCNMKEVDFMGAVFEECAFDGEIEDVTFRSIDVSYPKAPPNRLLRCDFTNAHLSFCQFLHLDLNPSRFLCDQNTMVLMRGPEDLREWQARIGKENYFIASYIEDSGTPTIMNRQDLLSAFSEEEVGWLDEILKRNPSTPTPRRMMEIYPGQIACVCSIEPPASCEELARLVEHCGSLPQDYLDVLAYANGFIAFIESDPRDLGEYFVLFSIEEAIEMNTDMDWQEYATSYFHFGSNGGGEAYVIDLAAGPSGMPYAEIPNIDLGTSSPGDGIENRFQSFDAMINELRSRAEIMSE